MNLPTALKDTVIHGSYRYPFAIHDAKATNEEQIMLYLHWHPEAELLLLLEGDALVCVDDRSYAAHAGDVIFVPPYTLHAAYTLESPHCHFLALVFQLSALCLSNNRVLEETYLTPVEKGTLRFPEHFSPSEDWQGEICRLMLEVTRYRELPQRDCDLLIRGKLLEIWHYMYLHARPSAMGNPDYDRIQPAIHYIRERYRNPITVAELAKQCSLSVSRFSFLFQKEMHMSAIPYLQEYRIRQSCALLLSSNMTVAAIAMETGFGNLSNFNRNFMRTVGCTPTEFRERANALRRSQESQTLSDDSDSTNRQSSSTRNRS